MLAFSFWQLTNPMMQGNYQDLIPIETAKKPFENQHHWFMPFA
jgi:hypothetical protein